jgi:hypothetical protein
MQQADTLGVGYVGIGCLGIGSWASDPGHRILGIGTFSGKFADKQDMKSDIECRYKHSSVVEPEGRMTAPSTICVRGSDRRKRLSRGVNHQQWPPVLLSFDAAAPLPRPPCDHWAIINHLI